MRKVYVFLLTFNCFCKISIAQQKMDYATKSLYLTDTINSKVITSAESETYLVTTKNPLILTASKEIKILKRISYDSFIVNAFASDLALLKNVKISRSNSLWKASDNLIALMKSNSLKKHLIQIIYIPEKKERGKNNITATFATKKVNIHQLVELLNRKDVEFATTIRKPKTEIIVNNFNQTINSINAVHSFFPAVNGLGINISVKENLFNITDIDLLGKYIPSNLASKTIDDHATIMSTIIGGWGNSYYKGLGVAPRVKLSSSYFLNLYPDDQSNFFNNNVFLQNHSYGTDIENYYSPEAQAYDNQISIMDSMVHVFSSGNIGANAPQTGVYVNIPGFANLSGGFKQAKNIITVGGTDKYGQPSFLSSRGPAYDGRVKPEIIADGENGTSDAAALTSGIIGLIQNFYKEKKAVLPPSALVKGILVNSADKINNTQVDFVSGFGKLNGLEAMRIIDEDRIKTGIVNNKDSQDFIIAIPDSISLLKATLTWNDPSATLNASTALINDLDLTITTPTNERLLPWVLSSYPSIDSLNAMAIRKKDTLNNVEQVSVINPPKGNYKISVTGSEVKKGPQKYFVTYSIDKQNLFEWLYPTVKDQIIGGQETVLCWKTTMQNLSAQVSVSYDNGNKWTQVTTVSIGSKQLSWFPPSLFTYAILKISVNGKEYESSSFSISSPLKMNVGYNCSDETLLFWNSQQKSLGYNVYNVKNNILQKIMSTVDTFVVIPKTSFNSNYFAVSAIGDGNLESIKSQTVDISTQGNNCYIKSLLAQNGLDNIVNLKLILGTTINLKSITWEKNISDSYSQIGKSSVQNGVLNYSFPDINNKDGVQYYRVTLETADGKSIVSNFVYVINLRTSKFALYPNPCNGDLNIITSLYNNYEVLIFDMSGNQRLDKTLYGITQSLDLRFLQSGMYVAIINVNSVMAYKFKFVKI